MQFRRLVVTLTLVLLMRRGSAFSLCAAPWANL